MNSSEILSDICCKTMYKYIIKNNLTEKFLDCVYFGEELALYEKIKSFRGKKIDLMTFIKEIGSRFFDFYDWSRTSEGHEFWNTHNAKVKSEYRANVEFYNKTHNYLF